MKKIYSNTFLAVLFYFAALTQNETYLFTGSGISMLNNKGSEAAPHCEAGVQFYRPLAGPFTITPSFSWGTLGNAERWQAKFQAGIGVRYLSPTRVAFTAAYYHGIVFGRRRLSPDTQKQYGNDIGFRYSLLYVVDRCGVGLSYSASAVDVLPTVRANALSLVGMFRIR
jgi:hypothetical protein